MINASVSAALMSQGSEKNVERMATNTYLRAMDKKKPMTDAQMMEVAKDFEAVFLAQMFSPMFGDSTGNSLFGNEESKDVYKSLLMNEYGKTMSNLGGIGIASHVKGEMLRLQEVSA